MDRDEPEHLRLRREARQAEIEEAMKLVLDQLRAEVTVMKLALDQLRAEVTVMKTDLQTAHENVATIRADFGAASTT